MNQILNTNLNKSICNTNISLNAKSNNNKTFHVQFILSIISIFVFVSLYFISQFLLNKKENISKTLKSNYGISQLYSKNSDENLSSTNPSSIIGIIEIPKLSISYPIFSYLNDALLKISPCRFYGEMPPKFSNLCIAGHNYDNDKFFSKINNLENTDKIFIYNETGTKFVYFVFKKYEVKDDDFSPIESDYSGANELTLITCNNLNQNRIIIKAKIENT